MVMEEGEKYGSGMPDFCGAKNIPRARMSAEINSQRSNWNIPRFCHGYWSSIDAAFREIRRSLYSSLE
jgi:hypothetical protein